jgi:hypothetical protein
LPGEYISPLSVLPAGPSPASKKILKIVQGFLKQADTINKHRKKFLGIPNRWLFTFCNRQEGYYMVKHNLVIKQVPAWYQPEVPSKKFQCFRGAPEDRQEKIESLTKAIRSNSYRIDYRKLADGLIASVLLGLLR